MYKTAGCFVLLEIAGLFGFLIVSRLQGGMLIRWSPLLVALFAISYVSYMKAKALSTKEIVWISLLVSVILILCIQFLGFTVYPGLAKDIDFFSRENAMRTGIMLLLGTVGHFLLLTLARTVR